MAETPMEITALFRAQADQLAASAREFLDAQGIIYFLATVGRALTEQESDDA